ncbi:adenylate/guanylate cyclase domain-containing protein [Adhaeribacter soli]|uniref:Guanylate cyclase domain-containing protein n=1 Tax=Adhaeribacter soli TaxID=2607655 RepID=A0A5N1IMF2_9BACT|nr:adenylate/guanylate cyclase domain-containing protein [Adhaeribacter soli]KAA9331151.1 hypothetical protein F0P94_14750 [Adhaeribacter soli]
MDFYNTYTETIRQALNKEKITKGFSNFSGFERGITAQENSLTLNESLSFEPSPKLKQLAELMRIPTMKNSALGEHPDFNHLKGTGDKEMHYITSAFIDIKGSTNLHKKHDLSTIYTITNTIQRAAIDTCKIFGGYIQRLQGDGVFVYFGGKGVDKNSSVKWAITATSFFTYFVKNDLKLLFEAEGIENINTRIGIDYGDDDDVMWASFGPSNCCEITTNSLHTSLASKMQAHATANGIVVGDHVKQRLSCPDVLFDLVRNSKGEVEHRYIYRDDNKGFLYTQYAFDWFNYLKGLEFIKENTFGKLYNLSPKELEQHRFNLLTQSANLINSGNARTDATGNISLVTGLPNQPHRFHYEDKMAYKKL